jgi:hypothetical protein
MRSVIACMVLVGSLTLVQRASAQANTVPKYDGGGALVGSAITDVSGYVGIGTTNPGDKLNVVGGITVNGPGYYAALRLQGGGANDVNWGIFSGYPNAGDFLIRQGGVDLRALTIKKDTGYIGIGTTAPASRLHVSGDLTIDGAVNARYQDVAEWVERVDPLDAGTIVTIDPDGLNRVAASTEAYDMRVAGAVSAQPGLVLGEAGDHKALVAQSGRVRVKVDATYGAIHAGDLLVTSPTPGHAMRSEPVTVAGITMHRPGTVLGKALEPLAAGRGEILVLLTLQ